MTRKELEKRARVITELQEIQILLSTAALMMHRDVGKSLLEGELREREARRLREEVTSV